jgi:hypothetical protein
VVNIDFGFIIAARQNLLNVATWARRKKMKKRSISQSLILGLSMLFALSGCQPDKNSPEAILQKVDAFQAMAIANEWAWSRKEIKSYVTTREIVFELSKNKIVKIALPEDKMMVAVAPYINRTHR